MTMQLVHANDSFNFLFPRKEILLVKFDGDLLSEEGLEDVLR